MRTRFTNLSLRWRLSWLVVLGTIVTVTLFGLFAYYAARDSAIESAEARLRSTIVQINTIMELGSVNQLETLRALAKDPAIIEALKAPALPLTAAAQTALKRLQGTIPNAVVVELVGTDQKTIHTVPALASLPFVEQPFVPSSEPAIGPLFERDGVMFFQSGVLVEGSVGAIRMTRRLTASSANLRIAGNLLGPEAALLTGNRDGKLWSGSGVVSYPGASGTATRYARDGVTWISSAMFVKGTPWLYAVEIPEHVALASARALVTPFLMAGALIVLAAAFVGLRISRRITTPLADLTAASEAIARGERNVSLEATDRGDEIGRLARAFATMATSVRAVQDRLESEVDTRTGELSKAVDRLRGLDEELRQSERFANLGRLSGSVSHELRNPLSVMSTVVFLLDGLPDASPKLKDYAKLLREQIRLSERIINDLLDRARSDAPVRSTVEVARLLNDLLDRVNIPAGIEVERRFPTSFPLVELDRDQVGQIVWNLVTNAVQSIQGASETGGTLTVGASLREGRLRIEVSDSGPGVRPEDVDRIFDAMYTTKTHGVGLGLSISRAFARANGGDLYLAETGKPGACFVLDLPDLSATEAAHASRVPHDQVAIEEERHGKRGTF